MQMREQYFVGNIIIEVVTANHFSRTSHNTKSSYKQVKSVMYCSIINKKNCWQIVVVSEKYNTL